MTPPRPVGDQHDADRATFAEAVPTLDHEIRQLAERIHEPIPAGRLPILLPADWEATYWDDGRED